jgi:hypothetical protein
LSSSHIAEYKPQFTSERSRELAMYTYPPNASAYRPWVVHPAPWDNSYMNNHQSNQASIPPTAGLRAAGEISNTKPVKSELYNKKLKIAEMVLKYEEYQKKLEQASSTVSSSEETTNVDLSELDSLKVSIILSALFDLSLMG